MPSTRQRPDRFRLLATTLAVTVAAAACASGTPTEQARSTADPSAVATTVEPTPVEPTPVEPTPVEVTVASGVPRVFPPAPTVPDGPLHPTDREALEGLVNPYLVDYAAPQTLLVRSDPRTLWVLADLLRFTQGTVDGDIVADAAEEIAGVELDAARPWSDLTNHLIAWDIPAPDDYRMLKERIYTAFDPRWDFVFSDPDSEIDHRLLGWGGVLLDDRPLGDPDPCALSCIPALDDPALTSAEGGDWYPDDGIVFGVTVDGVSIALPRNVMEVHELVNMTLGGRRVGIPYCTLCGSAQVYFTDGIGDLDRPLVLRTSGLLSRSNKVMYDLDTRSVFDTFTGTAVAGPLRERGVVLEQATVVTTTWGEWREAHPTTSIVAEDGGIGLAYPQDPLGGRDDAGPIFPIGDVDERLGVHEQVVGVAIGDRAVAFPAAAARATLSNGDTVELAGVALELDGAGLRATVDGEAVPSHQAFWFAWSQFHPDTSLWLPS